MERVGVLHQEFAGAHDAEARTDLVAKLGLNLIVVDRKLAVTLEVVARDVGDDFLVRGAQAEVPLVPVLELQQGLAVGIPASGFLPQLGRLHDRHADLERAGAVHLVADDAGYLVEDAHAERHPAVKTRGEPAQEAGAEHQLVADHLGIGRGLLERGERELA